MVKTWKIKIKSIENEEIIMAMTMTKTIIITVIIIMIIIMIIMIILITIIKNSWKQRSSCQKLIIG